MASHLRDKRQLGLSQDLETGCPKLAVANFFGILFFKGDHNILRLHVHLLTKIRHNNLLHYYGIIY